MRTKVAITIDTEPSVAGAFSEPGRYKPLLHEPVWGAVNGRSAGLGFIAETLQSHGLCATFFVETVHLSCFPSEAMGGYVKWLHAAGQDIQLHLHPVWSRFVGGRYATQNDRCAELPEERLTELIADGVVQIREWCGKEPRCLRTGNFSVATGVYRAMRRAGLLMGSNICVAIAPPKERPLHLAGGTHCIEGVTEVPVTCFRDHGPIGRGRYRPLQVAACSAMELCGLLTSLNAAGGSIAVIVTHPFEFMKWSGPQFSRLRANRTVQRRFRYLCRFLEEQTDCFEVVPLGQLAEERIALEAPVVLDGRAGVATLRAVENFLNDHLPSVVRMGSP